MEEPPGTFARSLLGSVAAHGALFGVLAVGALLGADALAQRRGEVRISVVPPVEILPTPEPEQPELVPVSEPDASESLVEEADEEPVVQTWQEPPLEPIWASDQVFPTKRPVRAEPCAPKETETLAAIEPAPLSAAESLPAGELEPAVLVSGPDPVYPPTSVRRGEEGVVLCELFIGADGVVTRVDVLETSGYERLDRAAVEALLAWRFRPATRAASPVPDTRRHRVAFRLTAG